MNIELEEVVMQDVSDYALELAAGGAQGVNTMPLRDSTFTRKLSVLLFTIL